MISMHKNHTFETRVAYFVMLGIPCSFFCDKKKGWDVTLSFGESNVLWDNLHFLGGQHLPYPWTLHITHDSLKRSIFFPPGLRGKTFSNPDKIYPRTSQNSTLGRLFGGSFFFGPSFVPSPPGPTDPTLQPPGWEAARLVRDEFSSVWSCASRLASSPCRQGPPLRRGGAPEMQVSCLRPFPFLTDPRGSS